MGFFVVNGCVCFGVLGAKGCRHLRIEFIIIHTPLCPQARRTFKLFNVQENRAHTGRVKNLHRRSRKHISS